MTKTWNWGQQNTVSETISTEIPIAVTANTILEVEITMGESKADIPYTGTRK
ncbi:hypothetical protein AB1471_17990 [Jeotgalibacillus marinus]|uniref:Uncharacterized protein n=1 Tax=Jeotgalibacillus marinus TaxID=86667 RepID=A0ABV3Q8L8_9BACL